MIPTLLSLTETASAGVFATAWQYLQKGGVFMIPLGITSVAAMTAILYKLLSLSRERIVPTELARQIENFGPLSAGNKEKELLETISRGESPLARLAATAIRHRGKNHKTVVMAVESAARQETAHLYTGVGVLDIAITISPLLGLIGTASGLVTIFQGLSDNADHLTIARGIAEALTTTIFGISIAVPCVIAHGYFNRKIEILTLRLESLCADLAHDCSGTESPN